MAGGNRGEIRVRPRPDDVWAGVRMVDANLLGSVEPGEGRIAGFERIIGPAAIALAVAQDAIDDARSVIYINKG